MRRGWLIGLAVAALIAAVPAVYATTTWVDPTICGSFAPNVANCGNIPTGGTIDIVLSQTPTMTSPPSNPPPTFCSPATSYGGFSLEKLQVTNTLTGVSYLLATGTSSSHKTLSSFNPLVISAGQTVTVPFPNNPSPTTIDSQGPFSWISSTHVFNPSGLTTSSTTVVYDIDEAGHMICGGQSVELTARAFVDQKATATVPEFNYGAMFAVSIALAGLLIVRNKFAVPRFQ